MIKLQKHKNMRDVAFKLLGEHSGYLFIEWWNLSATNTPFPIKVDLILASRFYSERHNYIEVIV